MKPCVNSAVFHQNVGGSHTILFPDLPGCISEGKSLENALYMAQNALEQWLGFLADEGKTFPAPSEVSAIVLSENEFVNLVRTLPEVDAVRCSIRTRGPVSPILR